MKKEATETRQFGTIINRNLAEDLVYQESPSSSFASKNVVIVMDALKEFTWEPLEWALAHVVQSGYDVTLLGIMPWLNLPLSCKTWNGVWALDLDDWSALKEMSQWKKDRKYQKVRRVIELCNKYGVVPHMKVAMGHPLRLVILEQTTSLHAKWVVLDKHLWKNRSFYGKRIPCNVVMMNHEGGVDMLKVRPMISYAETPNTPSASPASVKLIPKVIFSKELKDILKQFWEGKEGRSRILNR
ncbi:uncharacterized protein LOC143891373 [Tasmannia lanceolata]|uniref:uncharacterized protein LOC143891373 n=1 Tax=Tasmannia lanceolata TaxID=3420 RepID=UPI0040638965